MHQMELGEESAISFDTDQPLKDNLIISHFQGIPCNRQYAQSSPYRQVNSKPFNASFRSAFIASMRREITTCSMII